MKKHFSLSLIVAALFTIISPIYINASVNLQQFMNGNGVIPTVQAKEILNTVFMHNLNQLDRLTVELSNMRTRSDMNIAFFYVGRQEDFFNTEIYALTLDTKWNVIDGVMLGYDGDAKYFTLEDPNQQTIYSPELSINYELRGDTIKAIRNYTYKSTARGGNYFSKEGTITIPFLIRKDGKLIALQPTATAIQTQGNANYLSENHKHATTSTTRGEYYQMGMMVMNVAQTPASTIEKPEALNELAKQMNKIINRYGDNAAKNIETDNVVEFACWSTNYIIRQGDETLTWIANNPDQEQLSKFMLKSLQESGMGETDWLAAKAKILKDKKARKWWQNWLKKEFNYKEK